MVERQNPRLCLLRNPTYNKQNFDTDESITEYPSSDYNSSYTEPSVFEDSEGY